MFDMLNKLGSLKKKMEEIKSRLDTIYIEETGGNGLVKVTLTGNKKVKSIYIAKELCSPERNEELQDLLEMATNKALDKAESVYEAEMKAAGKDLLPGFPGLG